MAPWAPAIVELLHLLCRLLKWTRLCEVVDSWKWVDLQWHARASDPDRWLRGQI